MSEINHFRRDSGVSRFNYSARFDDKSGPDVVGINITTKKPKHRYGPRPRRRARFPPGSSEFSLFGALRADAPPINPKYKHSQVRNGKIIVPDRPLTINMVKTLIPCGLGAVSPSSPLSLARSFQTWRHE
jgi:hypothetical protein